MGYYTFELDLAQAKLIEKEFVTILKEHQNIKRVEFNNDYLYDVLIETEEGIKTYEIKHDKMSNKTGNLALEFHSRGKPSGISTSQADFWIYKLEDGFYKISLNELKQLVNDKKYIRTVSGGDMGSFTRMYLFSLQVIKPSMEKL